MCDGSDMTLMAQLLEEDVGHVGFAPVHELMFSDCVALAELEHVRFTVTLLCPAPTPQVAVTLQVVPRAIRLLANEEHDVVVPVDGRAISLRRQAVEGTHERLVPADHMRVGGDVDQTRKSSTLVR